MYVTLDLDDTLIETQEDYNRAIKKLGSWLAERTTVTPDMIAQRVDQVDRKNLEIYGLDKERFPATFKEVTSEYLESPSESDYEYAEKIARSAYKSETEYADRGFREGAKKLLMKLEQYGATKHLITSGDDDVQKRKINSLDLEDKVEEIDIVRMGGKENILQKIKSEEQSEAVLHIGNSRSSDVDAALAAGVPVIYVPDGEWRDGNSDVNDLREHPDVYVYDSIPDLLDELYSILDKEQERRNSSSKGCLQVS